MNWGNPNNSRLSTCRSGFGLITAITGQPRNIQLGARVIF